MSNTTGQGDTQPTEDASVPNNQPTSPADDNSDANNQPTSAAAADPSTDAAARPTSDAASDNNSATNDAPTDAATDSPSQASDNPSPTKSDAQETKDPSPSTEADQPSATQSDAKTSDAKPTSDAQEPSATNDDNSSTDEEASATEVTKSEVLSTVVTVTGSQGPETSVVLVTAITTQRVTAAEPSASASSTDDADAVDSGNSNSGGGLNQKSKVAIGVAVPIAAIAILALLGLFWWKKRKTRKQAEDERRKEVEDYAYNPNADPTIPAVGMADGGYEMREDGSSGYRGWGNTTIGSTGRKASTTMSGGGVNGQAYSDVTSPTARGTMSDARSGEPLMDSPHSPDGEILGAMGPSAANNRGADVHRGPSNASSSYSAAGRSDASDPMGMPYGAGGSYYDQYAQNNPYSDNGPQQAVIRDNPARRNTRIENPSHYPQQSAGISQNF